MVFLSVSRSVSRWFLGCVCGVAVLSQSVSRSCLGLCVGGVSVCISGCVSVVSRCESQSASQWCLSGVSVCVTVVSRCVSRSALCSNLCLGGFSVCVSVLYLRLCVGGVSAVLVSRSRRCLDLCLGGFSVWVLLVSRFMSRSCVFVVFRWRLGL